MRASSIIIMVLWLLVALGGATAFIWQVIQHWRSRTPLSSKKNAVLRLIWLLILGILGSALVANEGLGLNNVICAGAIMTGIAGWVLFWGHFIEQQVNRTFGKPNNDTT
jgi:hypothetical protein